MSDPGYCPRPPGDFFTRQVPVYELNLAASPLQRIHRSAYDPIFFNSRTASSTVFRFDAPDSEYGVLYAAATLSACIFETVIRDAFEGGALPLVIGYAELACRSVSPIGLSAARTLRLADFTQSLAPLGGSNMVMSINDYAIPNEWSLAVHRHPANFDGIYFCSRYSNEPCVALFDRAELVLRGAPVPLLNAPEMDGFLDQFQIALV